MQVSELERAREALRAIPANLSREEWIRALMGAHAAGIPEEDAEEWSAQDASFNAKDFRSVWRSIKDGKGIGPGTLFAMAQQHGGHAARRPVPAPHRAQERSRPPADGLTPAQLFDRFTPAAAAHPYILAKQGIPDGLRVVPEGDPLCIAGQSLAGALAVPVYSPDGSIGTIQFIPAPGRGKKLNLPGHPVQGWFIVGRWSHDTPSYLCEGIGQAWACWKATGRATVVTFGAGRMRSVAYEFQRQYPKAALVLVPDSGKEDDAEKIARELGCQWVEMPAGWPDNSDVNDLAQRDGYDELEALLAAPKAVTVTTAAPPFNLVPIADLSHVRPDPPCYAWEGLAPVAEVMLWAAHGGVGKSTVALMLGVAACTGRPLFGIPTRKIKVCFYSAEDGAAVVRHRLHFICGAMGVDIRELDGQLFLLDATAGEPALFAEVTLAGRREGATTPTHTALREFVKQHGIGLLIVDNASDTFDASEIERSRVRGFMRALANLARECDMAVILLAHVDKGTSRGDRSGTEGYSGSTAWNNSARSRLFMSRSSDGGLLIEHQKHNFGALHEPIRLNWPKGGIPQLDEQFGPVVQGIADRASERAILKLIAEFTSRGEYVSTAPTSRTHAGKLLAGEPGFPKFKRDQELFDLLRRLERAGRLERVTYKGADRKSRERWEVVPAFRDGNEQPAASAASAATSDVAAVGTVPAQPAASAATSAARGYGGESAHTDGQP